VFYAIARDTVDRVSPEYPQYTLEACTRQSPPKPLRRGETESHGRQRRLTYMTVELSINY